MHDLLAPAEEPGLWTPASPGMRIDRRPGFALVSRLERATVERVRVPPAEARSALGEVRALARGLGMVEVFWWVGDLAPEGTAEALLDAGLAPDDEEPLLRTLTTADPPPPVPEVPVTRIADLAGYREALEVDWEAWDLPEEARERRRASSAQAWESQRASGIVEHHVARVDGRAAGFGRLVLTAGAGVLMGGAIAPWARGRGAYRALVRARWDCAAARGTPRLVTAAGAMSAPLLLRLGFTEIGRVRLLRDPFV